METPVVEITSWLAPDATLIFPEVSETMRRMTAWDDSIENKIAKP